MSASIVFPEWLNSNSLRNYPIQENASRTDVSGVFVIPNSLIVGAQINYPRSYAGWTFFVSQIVSSQSFVTISISVQSTDTTVAPSLVASIQVNGSSFTPYSYFPFVGNSSNPTIIGSLAIGSLDETINEGLGSFTFLPAATPFETNCQFISVPALETVQIFNPSNTLIYTASEILKLKAGRNIRLTYEGLGSDSFGIIRIDAVNGENLVQTSDCPNQTTFTPGPIQQINGVGPDANGNFFIEGSECIQITPDATGHGIQIIDLCSQSCCGCTQLEDLTQALEQLRVQETTLQNLISSTQNQQSEMLANLIASL